MSEFSNQHATAMTRSQAAMLGGFAKVANMKRVLWHVLGGTRGGPLRIRILSKLHERPFNTNQLATELGVDYKTAQHHVRVLLKNRLIDAQGTGEYGAVFFLTRDMEASMHEFDAIAVKISPKDSP